MAKNWIAGAIKHRGALTKKAHAAGESPMAFARSHKGASGKTGKQSRLAITLSHLHGSGPFSASDIDRGYKTMKAPAFEPAWESKEHDGGSAQNVKGIDAGKALAESHPVAGRSTS
jgi:hypothetical protein